MTEPVVFRLRLPPRLKAWLDGESNANGRSTNDEIVARLEESRSREDHASPSREVLMVLDALRDMPPDELAAAVARILRR